MKFFIFLFSILFSFQTYSQFVYYSMPFNKNKCKVSKHKKPYFKAFYSVLNPDELENDFSRSVAMGDVKAVECLIKSGLLKKNPWKITSSLYISIVFSPKMSKRFIDLGADLHQAIGVGTVTKDYGNSRATALHVAIGYNRMEIFKYLLKKGADVNASGGHRHWPIQHAVFHDRYEMAKLLLQSGADPNRRLIFKNAFDIAEDKKSRRFMDLLKPYKRKKRISQ